MEVYTLRDNTFKRLKATQGGEQNEKVICQRFNAIFSASSLWK